MDFEQLEFESIMDQIRKPRKTPEELEQIRLQTNAKNREEYKRWKESLNLPKSKMDKSTREPIKFLYISDIFKSSVIRHRNGRTYTRKIYGVAVLTEDNYYYYNEVTVKNDLMNSIQISKLITYLTAGFKFSENTMVAIADTLDNMDEPILGFIKILSSAIGFDIKNVNYTKMLGAIGRFYSLMKDRTVYTKWMNNKVLEKMREKDMFVFMPEADWYEKAMLKTTKRRESIIECAVAMIYLDVRSIDNEENRELKKRREAGIKPKVYIPKEIRHKQEVLARREKRKLKTIERNRKKREKERLKNIEKRFRRIPKLRIEEDESLGRVELVNLFKWAE